MFLASSGPETPIKQLIINDIGPFVPHTGLERLSHYVGKEPVQPTLEDMAEYLKTIYHGFGDLDQEKWLRIARNSSKHVEGVGYKLTYDPAIGNVFSVRMDYDGLS